MSLSRQVNGRTRMSARVLGPFLVIVDVIAVARASEIQTVIKEFEATSLWSWVAGAFILLFGLVVIAEHQYWRGLAAVMVSILGWLIVLRGLFLLAFPDAFESLANRMIDAQPWWVAVCIAFALVGAYLTYVGWMPVRTEARSSVSDLPRAA